jgi:hypothetical protein
MATERRKQILLVLLLVVAAGLGYRQFALTSPAGSPSSNQSRPAQTQARGGTAPGAAVTAPEVHLEALSAERPTPSKNDRNLFRFKPKAPPPPPPMAERRATPVVPVPEQPAGPPPVPPITLKFLGTMNSEGKTIAVLSDGQGPAMYGVEGGTIAGRFRILRVGVESVEIAYLDGRGRQTIRVGGQ